jgi:PAS domain S-box-containing protein
VLENGSAEGEVGHARKDGTTFPTWMTVTVLMDAHQKPFELLGIARDITDRKRVEEQALIFQRFAEASGQGLGMATLQGQILYMNPTLCRMLDEDNLEDVYKKGFPEYYPPEFRERLLNEVLPKVMSGGQWVGELALASTKGKQTPTIENFFLIRDEEGRPLRLADVVTDITERKQMEDDLRKAKDAAEYADRAKSEFLANMSHEIRTPMTAILGYADLMLDENVGRATREHVAVIKCNGEHLLGLIGDILDLSKIEAKKLQIERTRCSPVQVVAEVVSLMRPQAAAKQLTLKTELAQPLPETVLTDPSRLHQILVNLVGNAIKFTDQGEIRLAVRLNAANGRLGLCFDVTDTGIGMNEEQIGGLFQPFSQVDSSSTRKFGGTGLGLCISKHLAEALGGRIEVRSEPGRGSTFSITIDPGPLGGTYMIQNGQEALLDRPQSAAAATPDKIALHGRILVAEDVMANQRLISLLLRKAGAEVTAVENGQLAVETALAAREAGEPFDVILMDMQMPVMDGYEATRQLRKRGYTAPIVALTAHAMAKDCQKCLDAGCDGYLPKPFQHRALLEMMARHITAEKRDELLSLCRRVRSGKPQAEETSLNPADPVQRS